jgi:plastocyanin
MRALAAGLLLALLMTAGCSDKGGDDGDADSGGSLSGGVTGPAGGAGAGAGGSSSATGTGGAAAGQETSLEVATSGVYPVNPGFTPATVSVPAGALVHVTFSNEDPASAVVQHNWVVEGIAGASSDAIGNGEQSAFDFTAPTEPGEFAFYCSIGDHRDRGMEGTLTVTA